MAIDIHKLIAAINPDIYCKKELRDEVKKIAKEEGYLKAAEKAELVDSSYMNFERVAEGKPFDYPGIKNPIEKHNLVYDAFGSNLEPLYYWLLDYFSKFYPKGTIKLYDNFISSTGSGHFSEMGQRATLMQNEAMKNLGAANQLVKSILNIIYDLKEFKIRLEMYDLLKSDDKATRAAATMNLKQLWMDTVDAPKRGATSLKGMAFGQGSQFVTLIDAFMAAEDENLKYKGEDMDLNERVRRVVQQKILEFNLWVKESDSELRKRFEIEKIYLQSQVSTLNLYSRWIKPYLKSARALEQRTPAASAQASLVTAFNATVLELTVLAQGTYGLADEIGLGTVDKYFKKVTKEFYPTLIMELQFKSTPERAASQGGYGFRGRLEANFTSYVLTKEELATLRKEIEKDDIGDLMAQIEGMGEESLKQVQKDIDEFTKKDDKKEIKKEEKKEKSSEDENPFSALFSFFKSEKKEEKGKDEIPKDTDVEKVIRSLALIEARKKCQKAYEDFKKTHGMPGLPLG